MKPAREDAAFSFLQGRGIKASENPVRIAASVQSRGKDVLIGSRHPLRRALRLLLTKRTTKRPSDLRGDGPGRFSFLFCGRRSAARLRRFLRGLRLLDDLRHVFQQLLRVVDYAVLDRPFHSADSFDLTGLIVQPNRARAVQDLQIRDRVFGNDDQVGQFTRPDYANSIGRPCC